MPGLKARYEYQLLLLSMEGKGGEGVLFRHENFLKISPYLGPTLLSLEPPTFLDELASLEPTQVAG